MSSSVHPIKTNDASILRKFELSKKEESLKNKLFNKPVSSKKKPISPQKSNVANQSQPPKAHQQDQLQNSTNFQQNIPNPYKMTINPHTDTVLDIFLKDMENEFKEISKSMLYSFYMLCYQIWISMIQFLESIIKLLIIYEH